MNKLFKCAINHNRNVYSGYKIFLMVRKFTMMANILYNPQCDYYTVLNVKETASITDIKKSFFALSMKLHPDKGGNENDFKKLNTAYEVLKKAEDRKRYDTLRQEYLKEIEEKVFRGTNNDNRNNQENKKSYNRNSYNYNDNYYDFKKNKHESYHYNNSYTYTKANRNDYNSSEYYHGNRKKEDWNSYNGSYNKAYDYDYHYTEFYEFIKKYQQYYDKNSYSTQNSDNNQSQFNKFKINVKYTPTKDILYPDFIIDKSHKHHRDNRMEYYKRLKLMNYIKLGYNPFELKDTMNEDQEYLDCLKRSRQVKDDESLNKKISLRDIFGVYGKSTLILFSLFNILFLTNIIIK